MSQTLQFAATMPEAKFRSTKKRVKQARPIRSSEQHHEARTIRLTLPQEQRPAAVVAVPAASAEPAKAASPKAAKSKSVKPGFKLASFWPVAVGIFLSGFAQEWHAMAAQAGVWTMRAIFPLTLLATHREIGIDAQMAAILPHFALYAQFPIDGLLTMLTLARGQSLKSAMTQLVAVHALCTFVLWLIGTNIA